MEVILPVFKIVGNISVEDLSYGRYLILNKV